MNTQSITAKHPLDLSTGTLIIFPGYLEHEYAVDHGKAPFRFIHWNITAIPKEMARNV